MIRRVRIVDNLKKNTVSGFFWRFAERCGAQLVSFVVSIVLARLLSPDDYGVIALVTVFITLSQVFIDSGMGNALIQKKNSDDLDFSSVFFFNIFICSILYILLFIGAPFIAAVYSNEQLTAIIRVLGIVVIVSALKNVQQAYVSKHMMFKKFFFATLGGTLIAAIIGIIMAYQGFGVWALVAQQIVNVTIDTIVLWCTVNWKPQMQFSFERIKDLYSYGWKLLVSSIINTLYDNLRQLIIGKLYSSADLAYYNRGKQFPNLAVNNINASIDSVLLPALAMEQDNKQNVKNMTRRAIKTSSYFMWPIMVGMAVTAEPIVRILLTEKWISAVPYLRIFCVVSAFQPIQTSNLNAIKAVGRSDLFLKLEVIKKSIGLCILFVVLRKGVMAIALSLLVYTLVAQIINSFPNKKLLNYSYAEQMKDILPYICLSLIMGLVVYPVSFLRLAPILILLIQVVLGVIIYWGSSKIFRIDMYVYIEDTIVQYLKKKGVLKKREK